MVTSKGIITQYDEDDEIGKIEDNKNNSYILELKNWREYTTTPETGQKVRFINNKGNAIQVRLLDEDDTFDMPNSNSNDTDTKELAPEDEKPISKEEIEKFKYDEKSFANIDDKGYSSLNGIKVIPITKSYQDTFRDFFENAIKISKSKNFDHSDNRLDYSLMRRFMITTYEHLLDKDPRFVNEDLLRLKQNLEDVYTIHKDLKSKLSNPNLDFESIFLKDQEVYALIKKKIEFNHEKLKKLESLSKEMETIIKTKEKKVRSLKGTSHTKELESIKKLNTKYANTLDERAIVKEQTDYLEGIEKEFVNKHEIGFLKYFQANAQELLQSITNIMNSNAYKFDTYMWKCAKESKAIKKFFIESSIEGSFSSRTFLRYFLATLDPHKMSKEIFKLKELLTYLDSQDRKSILIVDDKSYMLASLKYFVSHIDNFLRATSLSPSEAKLQVNEYSPDYIIINANIHHINLIDYVELVQKVHDGKNIEFILIGDKFKVDTLLQTKKLGIKHYVSTALDEKKMYSALGNIVLDSDEKELVADKVKE
jgi:hypothetical protein